jgi:hypothetical protein
MSDSLCVCVCVCVCVCDHPTVTSNEFWGRAIKALVIFFIGRLKKVLIQNIWEVQSYLVYKETLTIIENYSNTSLRHKLINVHSLYKSTLHETIA